MCAVTSSLCMSMSGVQADEDEEAIIVQRMTYLFHCTVRFSHSGSPGPASLCPPQLILARIVTDVFRTMGIHDVRSYAHPLL